MKNKLLIRRMCIIAVLSAVSTILYLPFLRIKLPFIFPDFLELQFSTLPAIIATFAYGPLVGIIITAIKTILKILKSIIRDCCPRMHFGIVTTWLCMIPLFPGSIWGGMQRI